MFETTAAIKKILENRNYTIFLAIVGVTVSSWFYQQHQHDPPQQQTSNNNNNKLWRTCVSTLWPTSNSGLSFKSYHTPSQRCFTTTMLSRMSLDVSNTKHRTKLPEVITLGLVVSPCLWPQPSPRLHSAACCCCYPPHTSLPPPPPPPSPPLPLSPPPPPCYSRQPRH